MIFCLILKINDFWVDLTDISAKKSSLTLRKCSFLWMAYTFLNNATTTCHEHSTKFKRQWTATFLFRVQKVQDMGCLGLDGSDLAG